MLQGRNNRTNNGTKAHNLQFHGLAFEFNCANFEVNTDGAYVALSVGIVCEAQQQTRLLTTVKTSISVSVEP